MGPTCLAPVSAVAQGSASTINSYGAQQSGGHAVASLAAHVGEPKNADSAAGFRGVKGRLGDGPATDAGQHVAACGGARAGGINAGGPTHAARSAQGAAGTGGSSVYLRRMTDRPGAGRGTYWKRRCLNERVLSRVRRFGCALGVAWVGTVWTLNQEWRASRTV